MTLTDNSDTFADIDANKQQMFAVQVPNLAEGDVLLLSVVTLPRGGLSKRTESQHWGDAPFENALDMTLSLAHEDLHDSLGESVTFTPSLHKNTYDFVLTKAHGLLGGKYLLEVLNQDTKEVVSVRVRYTITHQVSATPIRASQPMRGTVAANEFSYYRFVNTDPSKLMTVRVKPLLSLSNTPNEKGSPIGDPDLYVTNRYSGFIAVDKENAIWKSTNAGADRVDILPDDPSAARGETYIIGILGCKKTNDFELLVTLCDAEPITEILLAPSGAVDRSCLPLSVARGRYTYFKIPIDAATKHKIIIKIEPFAAGRPILSYI